MITVYAKNLDYIQNRVMRDYPVGM